MTSVTPNCGDDLNTRANSNGKEKEIVKIEKNSGVDRASFIGESPTGCLGEDTKDVVREKPTIKFELSTKGRILNRSSGRVGLGAIRRKHSTHQRFPSRKLSALLRP